MGLSKHVTRIEFVHDGYHFKMVDEWSSGIALYINNKEIGRNKQLFAIPFVSTVRDKGKFIDRNGKTVEVLVETPHTPFISTSKVYFNGIEVFKKTNVG